VPTTGAAPGADRTGIDPDETVANLEDTTSTPAAAAATAR
jgi:hypothetical protein